MSDPARTSAAGKGSVSRPASGLLAMVLDSGHMGATTRLATSTS